MATVETSADNSERDLYNLLYRQAGRDVEVTLFGGAKIRGTIAAATWRARRAVTLVGGTALQKDVYYVDIRHVKIIS